MTTISRPIQLVAATGLVLLAAGCGGQDGTPAPARTAAPAVAAPRSTPVRPAVADVKPPTDQELVDAALRTADGLGAKEPTRIRVWHASLRRIAEALTPTQQGLGGKKGDRAAAVVLIEGDFRLSTAPGPPGAEVPEAAAVAVAMDEQTGEGIAISSFPRIPPSLRILGAPDRVDQRRRGE